jgi:Transposase DDE domain
MSVPRFVKQGAIDCKHIFAERLYRGEVAVVGELSVQNRPPRKASRRPARKRIAQDGRTVKTTQRHARRKLPSRSIDLLVGLGETFLLTSTDVVIPIRPQIYRGGRKGSALHARALALIAKTAERKSASAMHEIYEDLIRDHDLPIKAVPSENTLSRWINDERLTPILHEYLRITSLSFRERETACIIDSTKLSQIMYGHARSIFYGTDKRENADWMKCHAVVGADTMVVMAADFSGSHGEGTHDINFLLPLLEHVLRTFAIKIVLADKAYLSDDVLNALKDLHIMAAIPLKKNAYIEKGVTYDQAIRELVEWFNRNDNRDFHEVYRVRAKVEALFSLVKRMTDGYCWSRGLKAVDKNKVVPCTAWQNEALCKLICSNIRRTVDLEEQTGYRMDYRQPNRRFPQDPEPLITAA